MTAPSPRPLAPALFLIMGSGLLWSGPPLAAGPGPTVSGSRQFLSGSGADSPPGALEQIAASLARRWKVRVLVDPALPSSARPGRPDPYLPIDQALNAALAPLHRVSWRRLYLPPRASDSLPPTGAIAAAVRSLERPETASLLLEDSRTERVTACLKDQPIAAPLEAMRRQAKLDPQPIYLIFRTGLTPDEPVPESRIADLQRQQLELPLRPEHQALAMAQMVRLLQELPPADREAFASRTLAAGMRLWDSTPAGQRTEMIQQSLQLMQAFGAPTGSRAAGGDRSPSPPPLRAGLEAGAPPRNAAPGDARALAAALAARYGAPFLIDPSLLLPASLPLPAADLPAEKALAALLSTLPGAAGRRVYLPEAQQKRLPLPERLAAAARGLDELSPFSFLVEDLARGRATLYVKERPATSLPMLIEQGGLSDHALYLLYNSTPAARGGTLEERVADLQRQQMGLLLRMSPEQMALAAEPVIRAFAGADAETRSRLMSLPAMAGLMAVWMPREAKERQQPLAP